MNKGEVNLYNEEDFTCLHKAGRLASKCLDFLERAISPGITTEHIDELAVGFIKKHGGIAAPLGYRGFPRSICTSVNHIVCHGIPGKKKLSAGDIINIDVTVILDGFHGDTSRSFAVGEISLKAKKLLSACYQSLLLGIKAAKPGNRVGDIGYAIQSYAEKKGYSVVREFCGHGIGRNFHEAPEILHYGEKDSGMKITEGMVFTIEPMLNIGKKEVMILNDGWTVITRDRSLSAQFEHSIGINNKGAEIFTLSDGEIIE